MGELFLSGQYNTDRVISLAGPVVTNPRLVRTTIGACLSELTEGELAGDVETRTISGSVLYGHQSEDSTPEDVDGFIVDTVEEYELIFRKRLAMGHEVVRNPEPPLLIGFYDATAGERWMMYIEDYKTSGDLKKQKEIQDMDDDAFEQAYATYQANLDANAAGKPYDYLNRYDLQVSCLAEDRERVFLGWLGLGAEKFSTVRTYLSGWMPKKDFDLTTTTNGSHRAMVPIGMFERVMPLDIMPTFLLRSLLVGDLERAEQLGCLELHEEDLALCSFVSPGKESYGKALRNVLTEIWQEG
jgi:Na+-transporting NADH:ubiquinone oxidoreductase subunit NqrA